MGDPTKGRVEQFTSDPDFEKNKSKQQSCKRKEALSPHRVPKHSFTGYTFGKVKFDIQDKTDRLSAAIELARLADKYGITGIESDVSDYIQYIIDYQDPEFSVCNDNNTWLISDHIIWGSFLPREHPVRRTLAVACVAGYLGGKNHKFA
ncbi:hypothetical protein N7453_007033 [Penicillium expansum]|nr:hypothetical protein N7453_007033 [Penicillium expansum]